ncbi:MAG: adenylate/guanylate cyclase domain-containing protein, partial [Saprospiraceae bacterium]
MSKSKENILQAIELLNNQRSILGDAIVDAALLSLAKSVNQHENAEGDSNVIPTRNIFLEERRLVTVMFADFSNFTAMSGKMDAEDLRALMNAAFSNLVPIIERYQGHVDKFIGDEIMALFGAPKTHEHDAEYALRAALEMMQELESFNVRNQTNLGIHFGINTGVVIAGGVGSDARNQYSVIGEAVNLAARLEDASVTGEILIGHDTYRLTHGIFDFEKRKPIFVKGIDKPVSIYKLLGVKKNSQPSRGIQGFSTPLVGRDEYLNKLKNAAQETLHRKSSVISIIADPGFGKSRLVEELLHDCPDFRIVIGKTNAYSSNLSYFIVRNLIDNILGINPGESIEEVTRIMQETLLRLSPFRFAELYPYLARLRDIPLDYKTDQFLRAVSIEAMLTRMQQAFLELLILYKNESPLIVVWEDLHWSDRSSLELIEYVIKNSNEEGILHVCLFRPHEGLMADFHLNWKELPIEYTVMQLAPLTEENCFALLEKFIHIEQVPENTKHLIIHKSGGNPFYLEEYLRSLIESGILEWENNKLKLIGEIDELAIPDTLRGLISSRIDSVNNSDKKTLLHSSVIGMSFAKTILKHLMDPDFLISVLDLSLLSLEKKDLIFHKLQDQFLFKHALTQDVAYHQLLKSKRAELHQYIAEFIEKNYLSDEAEIATSLAYHYSRAGIHKKAFDFYSWTGDKARLTFSYHESAFHYRNAIEEAKQISKDDYVSVTHVYENLGEVLIYLSLFEEARETFEQAITELSEEEFIARARLYRKKGESYKPQRKAAEEISIYDLALKILEHDPNKDSFLWNQEWLQIQLNLTWSNYWLNRVDEMEEALNISEKKSLEFGTLNQQSTWFARK